MDTKLKEGRGRNRTVAVAGSAIAVAGFVAWYFATNIDRTVEGIFAPPDASQAAFLIEHAERPASEAKVRDRVTFWLGYGDDEEKDGLLAFLDEFFDRRPLPADLDSVVAVISAQINYQHESARNWIENYSTDPAVLAALRSLVDDPYQFIRLGGVARNGSDETPRQVLPAVVAELEYAGAPVDDELVELIVASAVQAPGAIADSYLERGFPRNGQPLRTDSAVVQKPPDPRVARAVYSYLGRWRLGDSDEIPWNHHVPLVSLLRAHPPEPEVADGLVSMIIGTVKRIGGDPNFSGMIDAMGPPAHAALRASAFGPEESEDTRLIALTLLASVGAAVPQNIELLYEHIERSFDARRLSDQEDWSFDSVTVGMDRGLRFIEAGLKQMGRAALPAVIENLTAAHWARQVASFGVLADTDPSLAATELNRLIDARMISMRKPGVASSDPAERYTPGLSPEVFRVARLCFDDVTGNRDVDEFYMRLLAHPSDRTREGALALLKTRFDRDQFVEAFFAFVVRRQMFSSLEIDAFTNALVSYDGIEEAIGVNLNAQIEDAGNDPERVYWLLKYISLSILEVYGSPEQVDVVRRLLDDQRAYTWISTQTDQATGKVLSRDETPTVFADHAARVIESILNPRDESDPVLDAVDQIRHELQ